MVHKDCEQRLAQFIELYQNLNKENLDRLKEVYHPEIIFEDPAHRIAGYDSLFDYFKNLYLNVNQCDFFIDNVAKYQNVAFINWQMTLSHPKLANGLLREIKGCSQITFKDNFVIYQRDYFDLGEFIYEAIPVLGSVIRQIKKRLGQ